MTLDKAAMIQLLCEKIIKLVDRPDIVLIMFTDADCPLHENTRIMCNLGDYPSTIRYIGEMLQIIDPRKPLQ